MPSDGAGLRAWEIALGLMGLALLLAVALPAVGLAATVVHVGTSLGLILIALWVATRLVDVSGPAMQRVLWAVLAMAPMVALPVSLLLLGERASGAWGAQALGLAMLLNAGSEPVRRALWRAGQSSTRRPRLGARGGGPAYGALLRKASGDEALVERLIRYEERRTPGEPREALARSALERWERDRG
jgi:hypothetical protein